MAKLTSFPSTGCCNSVDKRLLDFLIKRNNGKSLRLDGRKSVGWNTTSYWTIANIENSNKPKYEFKDLLPFLVPKPDVSSFEPYHINDTITAGTRVIAISDDTVDDDYIIGDKGLVCRVGSSMVEVKFDKDNELKRVFKYHLAFLPEHQDAMLTDYDFDTEGDYDEEPSTLSYIPLTEKPRSNERVICLKDSETSNEYHIGWVGTVNDDNSNVPTIKWDNGIESVVYYTHLAYINETLKTHDMRIGEVYKLTCNNFWTLFKVNDNSLIPNSDYQTIKSVSAINSMGSYSWNSNLRIAGGGRTYRVATNFECDWLYHCMEKGHFVSEADYALINIEEREIKNLIDEAHDKYPIGTYVRSLFHSNNPILKITSEVFSYYAEQKRVDGIGETSFLPIVYLDGKWAEIVGTSPQCGDHKSVLKVLTAALEVLNTELAERKAKWGDDDEEEDNDFDEE